MDETPSIQRELFPYASPETVLAYCRRLEAITLMIAPEMSAADCNAMLAELSLATLMLEKIERRISQSVEWIHRKSLTLVPPIGRHQVNERFPWHRIRRQRPSTNTPAPSPLPTPAA